MTEVSFCKQESELRLVYAEVYAPNRPDSDGDFMTVDEIRKMAHGFTTNMRLAKVDVQHDNQTIPGVVVVESFIARKGDPDFIAGAWVVGIHVNDDATWSKIKAGELNGLSMESAAFGVEKDVEVEIPSVVQGETSSDEGHKHMFYVTYDDTGKFMGGVTDVADSHRHIIKAGTKTETASGHTHRFSSVDTIEIVDS